MSNAGRGSEPSSVPPDHLDLGIIRERGQATGGTIRLESWPGHGTKVLVIREGEE